MTDPEMARVYRYAEGHAEQILEMAESGCYGGFCTSCGIEVSSNVDPDACGDPCESCGEKAVYGAQELMLYAYC